jgi:hypothetical protein
MFNETLQYPIGKFAVQESYSSEEINTLIASIQALPEKIEEAYHRILQANRLDIPYRPEGWTARQVLHHLPDSHLNAYIRTKWTLTEPPPVVIKAYNEKTWAETPETTTDPVVSVVLLRALHTKWVLLLNALTPNDLLKSFEHPETGKSVRLDRMIALYAWHGEHHLGHLNLILNRKL